MPTTINLVQVDFGLGVVAPTITFLQGADMSVPALQDTFRLLEESDEGKSSPFKQIITASGNEPFDATTSNALTITVLEPYVMKFQAGATPFQSSNGNLLGSFVDSPGAIVQINNAVGLIQSAGSGGYTETDRSRDNQVANDVAKTKANNPGT